MIIPANTSVTVNVTVNGGFDSINLPGYLGGTIQNVPDLRVPCPVTLKGKVVDCENKPVPYVKVTASGSSESNSSYTNNSGEYSVIVPANTSITIRVTANGGSDSIPPSEYLGGIQNVPNLKVPCIDDGGTAGPLTWNFTNGLLTISGSGAMPDYIYNNNTNTAPWSKYRNEITIIRIEDFVTRIGNRAFDGYENLRSVTLGNGIKSIGEYAFAGCENLPSIDLKYVTSIEEYAFGSCGITSLIIPDYVISIGEGAFYINLSLVNVSIGNNLKRIENVTFFNCQNLQNVIIGNSVESIGDNAFSSCARLSSVNIPGSVKSIGLGAFRNCYKLSSLSPIILPSSLISIGELAFAYTNIESIDIPHNVKSIGEKAFAPGDFLCSVISRAYIPPTIHENTFGVHPMCRSLCVPHCRIDAYYDAGWLFLFFQGGTSDDCD